MYSHGRFRNPSVCIVLHLGFGQDSLDVTVAVTMEHTVIIAMAIYLLIVAVGLK